MASQLWMRGKSLDFLSRAEAGVSDRTLSCRCMTNSQTSEGRAAGRKEARGTAGKHWPPVVWVCFGGSLATAQSTAWTSLIIDINNDGQQLVTVLVLVWISSKLSSNSADDDVIGSLRLIQTTSKLSTTTFQTLLRYVCRNCRYSNLL